ncbi:hypothetical protein [Azospirillum tabaci]|uniref:hypothetical protein n=1 Tax=Azospirillum tabaci TaxID=2752310 RepID=UPI0016615EE5|nr:hypothetical protein [Azospirillum tabaci]
MPRQKGGFAKLTWLLFTDVDAASLAAQWVGQAPQRLFLSRFLRFPGAYSLRVGAYHVVLACGIVRTDEALRPGPTGARRREAQGGAPSLGNVTARPSRSRAVQQNGRPGPSRRFAGLKACIWLICSLRCGTNWIETRKRPSAP